MDYVKGGGGSGDVTVSHITGIYDGFRRLSDRVSLFEGLGDFYRNYVTHEYARGRQPGLIAEPVVPEDLLSQAAAFTDTAVISLCRFSGEGWDRKASADQDELFCEPWVGETARQSQEIFERGDFYLSRARRN